MHNNIKTRIKLQSRMSSLVLIGQLHTLLGFIRDSYTHWTYHRHRETGELCSLELHPARLITLSELYVICCFRPGSNSERRTCLLTV
jgi:hypothetical protein